MKKILTVIIIGLLCFSMISVLMPNVMGWASTIPSALHEEMARDALQGTGWSDLEIADIAFMAFGGRSIDEWPSEYYDDYYHRVQLYQDILHIYHESPCDCEWQGKYGGAEDGACQCIQWARSNYTIGNEAEARKCLGRAIHFIQDAVCPPHVLPFSEKLTDTAHWHFEAYTANGYGDESNNWKSRVSSADTKMVESAMDLRHEVTDAAAAVWTRFDSLPPGFGYVRQDGIQIGDLSGTIWGWKMSSDDIGWCMEKAASLVKGAAIYVRGGVQPEVVCVPFHGKYLGVPHDAWIGKEIVLKGTAHDPDGDGTLAAYKWDFGDGYSTGWIAGVNPYVIEAKHTYSGTMADGTPYESGKYFTAWLYVRDASGLVGQDSYFIAIRDKTLDVEVNVAIDDGLWWLHKQAYRYTSGGIDYARWSSVSSYYTSATAESVLAFEIQGHQPIGDPDENPYVETVQRGLNYVFTQTRVVDISAWGPGTSSPYGDPDTNGNDKGIGISSGQEVYELGMVMMAIAASGDPDLTANTGPTGVVGRTYRDILTDMVDLCAWGQNDYGGARGGWRYGWNYGSSDNSVSQWPMMALEAAETNWGIAAPSFVKTELDTYWLTYSQRADGGFGYTGPDTANIARTGTGIIGLNYVGLPADNPRITKAVNWLGTHWSEFGNYYGMYAVMKGMRTAHPEISMVGIHDWYAEYARYLVDHQLADDGWPDYYGRVLATDWAILILTPTVTQPGPVADAGPDVNNFPPTIPLEFDASGSYHMDPTKSIVLYEWDFESDGTWDYSGTDLEVEHAYPAYYNPDGSIDWGATAKDYTATLRVTDNSDPPLQDTDACVIHITAPPWKPVADPDGPYEGWEKTPLQLDGSKSYDPESKMYSPDHPWYETIATYEWDLDNDGLFDDSMEIKPSYMWESKGTYSVGLKVTDSQPSGPGGTIGPLDVDIKYVTVVIKTGKPNLITVTIVEVKAIDSMDPWGPLSPADFYAKVKIDWQIFETLIRSNDDDIYPEWSFSTVSTKTNVPIHIEIWDSDWPLSDDHVDIHKDSNHRDLDLFFDVATQSLSGDITYGYSRGGGGDGNRAEIWFNVGLDTGDMDGDGLFDSWENTGIHMNDDGVVDLDLPVLGTNPDHKDLFVEIDWMEDETHSHRPTDEAMQIVIDAFANAPLSNPDGTTGITLHIDFSNGVPHQDELRVWGDFDTVKVSNFDSNRRFVYHYSLFAHRLVYGILVPAGVAELPGNDFVIGLGDPPARISRAHVIEQAGVFMHEFGHNLDLKHGGDDHLPHRKPNYLSVMNYLFTDVGIPPTNRIDYSRSALPSLDENNLNENLGIQDGTDNTFYYTPAGAQAVGLGTGSINWDDDGIIETSVQADINRDGTYIGPIRIPRLTVLTGYDDWPNLLFNSRGLTNDFEDYVHEFYDVEVDIETLRSIRPTQVIQKFAEGPIAVPLYTLENWNFTFTVTNIYDYELTDVTVKDYFGANLNVAFVSSTKGTYTQYTNKPGLQQRFEWNIGNLAPWETVSLKLKVSTGLNPAKKQEFTQTGLKILNSDATVKWINNTGQQESAESGQVSVWAGVSVSSTTGAIAGYVKNATTGTPLQGYVIELHNTAGELLTSVTTDKNGFYAFSSLEPTDYIVACQTMSYTVPVVAEQVTKVYFEFE